MAPLADEVIREALQRWNQGDQQGAVDLVRAAADAGDRHALALVCWFLYQRGEPYWREGVPYAERAVATGMPWIIGYYLGNMQNDPALRARIPDIFASAMRAGYQGDPVTQAYTLFTQGDPAAAVRLVDVANAPLPYPESWEQFLTTIQTRYNDLAAASTAVGEQRQAALAAIQASRAQVDAQRAEVETRSQQLLQLIEQITNAEAQTFFEDEAKRYGEESTQLWNWGIGVLSAAAILAVLPLLIYYAARAFDKTPWIAGSQLAIAHTTPAIALAAVASVLLARSRRRDRARQRARDLSVALATMFVYSGQIADEAERQRFLHEMGRAVLEAFLRHDADAAEPDSASPLAAIRGR